MIRFPASNIAMFSGKVSLPKLSIQGTQMRKLNICSLIFMILFLTACGNNHDKYIGHYKYPDRGGFSDIGLVEIKKDGENYLFIKGVRKPKPKATEKTSDGLKINSGPFQIPITLSSDEQSLYFSGNLGDKVATRITEDEYKAIAADVEARFQERFGS